MPPTNQSSAGGMSSSNPQNFENLDEMLLSQIRRGSASEVGETLAKGVDADVIHDDGSHGITGLCLAISLGHEEIANLLLKHGAPFKSQIGKTSMALHLAAQKGMTGLCRKLIKKGADIDAMSFGGTALDFASENGHLKTVRLLIQAGADVNLSNHVGFGPLHGAAMHGHKKICTELLDAGAQIDARSQIGLTPLMLASRSDWAIKATELLLSRGADINAIDNDGKDAMHEALGGRVTWKTILTLHDHEGFKSKTYGPHEETMLHRAAYQGNVAGVFFLIGLEEQERIHAKDKQGNTPLHHCMERGHEIIAEVLLSQGADVNAKNNEGFCALHSLCGPLYISKNEEARVIILRELIKRGVDVNQRTNDGSTPLHLAAAAGLENVCIELMTHGADMTAKNGSGLKPAGVAGRHQNKALGDRMKDYAQSLAARRAIDDMMGGLTHKMTASV